MQQYNLKTLKVGDVLDLKHATFVVDDIDHDDIEYPISLRLSTIKSADYKSLTADPHGAKFDTVGTSWWLHVGNLSDFGVTDHEVAPTTGYNLDTLKVGDIVKTPHAEFEVEYVYPTADKYPLSLRLKSILSCKYKPLDAAANTHKPGKWFFNTVGDSYYLMHEALPDFGISTNLPEADIGLNDLPAPFYPEHDEEYYSITLTGITGSVARFTDASVITEGNCFRTEEDAQAWLDAMRSRRGPKKD
jgi:hypothetical protein